MLHETMIRLFPRENDERPMSYHTHPTPTHYPPSVAIERLKILRIEMKIAEIRHVRKMKKKQLKLRCMGSYRDICIEDMIRDCCESECGTRSTQSTSDDSSNSIGETGDEKIKELQE